MRQDEPARTGDQPDRDTRGRFRAGNRGNVRGRPVGSRNKASLLVERMLQDEAGAIAETAINLAKAGDVTMLKCCLERLLPARKSRPISLDLPEMEKVADLPKVTAAVLHAVVTGSLGPAEAADVVGLIGAHRQALEMVEIERRLEALETKADR